MKALLWSVSAVMYPAFVRAPLRAFSCALRQLALLLRLRRLRVTVSLQILFGNTAERFLRSLRKCRASALGSMAHSLNGARPRSGDSTNGDNHVPEQSNPHRLPRQQRRSPHQQRRLQRHHAFAGNQVLLQEGWQVHLAHRMASLASSSASSQSSPRRSPRAHISRWKASCAAGSTRARRRTPNSASGKFGSLRSSSWTALKSCPGRSGARGNAPGGNGRIGPCSSLSEARLLAGLPRL